jgi:2,3-bisphosphoglycerate-independent phosphoglycerate mutase
VPSYDHKPEMSVAQVAEEVDRALAEDGYGFAIVNLANPDMVGHTGSIPAAVKAVEATDEALGRILAAVEREGGIALVTADHGNAEEMLDDEGKPQTAHTSNPVPLVATDPDVSLRERGELSDLVPTAISLLGLAKPLQMTGHNLCVENK